MPGLTVRDQGIVHVIGPELGLTQPGKTLFAATAIHPLTALSARSAFGIGTSEVEHVLATQTILANKTEDVEIRN